jgi:hypothetical protein
MGWANQEMTNGKSQQPSKNEPPKARANLWRYEPDGNGWASYGMGTVSADGRQIIRDAGVVITDFASAECQVETRTRQRPPERPDLRQRMPAVPMGSGKPPAAGKGARP